MALQSVQQPVPIAGVGPDGALRLVVVDVNGNLGTTGGGGSGGAGEAHLGEVGGNSAIASPAALAVTVGAYAAGNVVGGLLTFTGAMRRSGGTGVLQSMFLVDASNTSPALNVYLFNQSPAAGTYTDKSAVVFSTDTQYMIRRIAVAAADWVTDNGIATADLSPGGRILAAVGSANLYAVIVAGSAPPTFVATTNLTLRIGLLRD